MEVIYSRRMTLAEAMEELPSRARLEAFDNEASTNNRIKKAEVE